VNKITAIKADVLIKLQENREQHALDYEAAKAGYLETALEEVDALTHKLMQGEVVALRSSLMVPECHLEDYDRAIQMLTWHHSDTIEITMDEFAHYVQDDWDWKGRWKLTNCSYIEKVRGIA
jgi:hypothetical protein